MAHQLCIARGARGVDVGSGCGYDTYIMARHNPSTQIVSIDLSDGVYENKKLAAGLKNVRIIKGSCLDMPLKNEIFDFAYSFGVLHHTPDPRKGLLEIVRVLKKGCPAFIYLYEDHSENPVKYIFVKIVSVIRRITTKIPPKLLYCFCWVLSPFIFLIFSVPAKILKRFKKTGRFSEKIPFNFATNPFSLRGDLCDRFSAPIEYRFSRLDMHELLSGCSLNQINIERLKEKSGWVAWGYKY